MSKIIDRFFKWYNKHYLLNISIALALFLLQLIHLYWLGTDVIAEKLTNQRFFPFPDLWLPLLILVDYIEIPALFTTSLIYINELRKRYNFKSLLFLILLLSQFLHIFWITDEYVIEHFTAINHQTILSGLLAWFAILIDYAEVPVIIDTVKRLLQALKEKKLKSIKKALK